MWCPARIPEDLLARAVRRNRVEGDVSHRRAALMKLVLSYGREGAEMTDALEKLDQNQQGHEHIPSNRPQRNQRTEHHERAHIERVATHAARRLYRANLDSD